MRPAEFLKNQSVFARDVIPGGVGRGLSGAMYKIANSLPKLNFLPEIAEIRSPPPPPWSTWVQLRKMRW